ncbi:type II secretion system F family protein [Methanolapillus millepedarum]|uniref:Type II secretion system protein GspF domain-containing protein n=1 Tax=Methanolapillus millepedarum TaxID=3028296 RepID=A0AA96VDX5_9EURY|nr:hypothetical protein MsAc7_04160 [Methanosarcinaceae archaeon Ac7]
MISAGAGSTGKRKNTLLRTFEKKLVSARLFIPLPMYLSVAVFLSVILFTTFSFCEIILFSVSYFSELQGYIEAGMDRSLMIYPVFIFVGAVILIWMSAVAFPFLAAADKKHKLEQELPFAVNYMSAMASAGVLPDLIFQTFSEKKMKFIYGTIASEFSILESRIFYLGEDLPSALQFLSASTPSPLLADFLSGAKNTLIAGSDFQTFIFSKKQEYESLFRRQKEQNIQTLDLLSEMYITVFLAAPIFFIILLFTITPLSGPKTEEMKLLVYQAVPFLGIFFLLFADVADQKNG